MRQCKQDTCDREGTRLLQIWRNNRFIRDAGCYCPSCAITIAQDIDRYATQRGWGDRARVVAS